MTLTYWCDALYSTKRLWVVVRHFPPCDNRPPTPCYVNLQLHPQHFPHPSHPFRPARLKRAGNALPEVDQQPRVRSYSHHVCFARVNTWRSSETALSRDSLLVWTPSLIFGTRQSWSLRPRNKQSTKAAGSSDTWHVTVFRTSSPINRRSRNSTSKLKIKRTGHFKTKSLMWHF